MLFRILFTVQMQQIKPAVLILANKKEEAVT